MNKAEYLKQLEQELSGIEASDCKEILRDQEEHINEAVRSGRSESDVIESLGSPKTLGREILASQTVSMAESETKLIPKFKKVIRAIFAVCLLAPFNLILVLGPFLAICAVLIAFWAMAFSTTVVGVVGVGFTFLGPLSGFFLLTAMFFGSLSLIGLSILLIVSCYYSSIFFLKFVVRYIQFNYHFAVGGNK